MVKEDLREFKQTIGHLYQFVVKFVRALPCTLHCGLCKTGKALTNSIWLDKVRIRYLYSHSGHPGNVKLGHSHSVLIQTRIQIEQPVVAS